jgi:SNF2 family DNA or RNA helicase
MINIVIKESVKCNGDNSLFITFDYDEQILSIIKSFSTRFYDVKNKSWEVPFNKLGDVVNKLSNYDIDITGKYIKLNDTPRVTIPKNFKFKTEPYKHQIQGVEYGLNHDKWLLGDEQGLGKTKQVIDIARVKKVKHCLIICCVNGLKWNWRNEVYTHSDDGAFILGQDNTRKDGKIIIGSNADKLEDLNNLSFLPRFIITNIETLRYKVKTGRKIKKRINGKIQEVDEYRYPITEKLKELCNSGEIEMIAVDEFHKCKNPDAEQAQQILELHTPIQIAMTGTPLMNAPLDLYMPLNWLGYERHSFYQFKTHHCKMGGYGGYQVVGYKNLEELDETLSTMMLRRLKEKVLDLPEKILINEYVEMGKEQALVYSEAHSDIANNIDKIKMANNPLSELIRLRQATGYTAILSSTIKESAKFDRMEELVDDAIENGHKVVIFSNWTQITNPAFERLSKKYSGVMITGETKDNERQSYVDRFQNDDRVKFIIGTIGAMGTGLTLTAGTVEIFLDEPWNMALKEQAIDRCHRIGAKSNITIYTLLCKDTIDERINELVEKKGAMSDILVDGKIEGDKNALINYLLS